MTTVARRTQAARPAPINGRAPSTPDQRERQAPRATRDNELIAWLKRSTAPTRNSYRRRVALNGDARMDQAPQPTDRYLDEAAATTTTGDEHCRRGVEVRVHGIGDHATYSALGKPNYKELVDSRVWIGHLPSLPPHKMRLVNWSRANRKITRHFNWYVAFPFTLLNVAGYMEPKEKTPRRLMRSAIGVASVCLTIAMAAWISAIVETAWRGLTTNDDRLTGVVLQAVGPTILIVFIVYRMIVGRALVDRGGAIISLASIAALLCMIYCLHFKPASRTTGLFDGRLLHGRIHRDDRLNAIDAMTTIVVHTTALVWVVALGFCLYAVRKKKERAGFAGAALLLVLAVSLMHAAGSMLRLFTASLLRFKPLKDSQKMEYVLLPAPDDLQGEQLTSNIDKALRIDLIPVFFLVMLLIFGVLLWLELWCRRSKEKTPASTSRRRSAHPAPRLHTTNGHRQLVKSGPKNGGRARAETKAVNSAHLLVEKLPQYLAPIVIVAILVTGTVWIGMTAAFAQASPRLIDHFLLGLKIIGAVAIVLIIMRRPEGLAEKLRRTFGSIADIAGFWAPDLHPLAGASYRRALLSGIRQTISDLVLDYPDEPIALVGHSQGSVVCAWFVRGGHWTERRTEAKTDRRALKDKLHDVERQPSNRIALFTCGSPLCSLYAAFFPRYFDRQFFETTRCMTQDSSHWRNYWRKTDPIASRLPVIGKDNVDVTELKDEETRGHSEYWREERLRADIEQFFETAQVRRSEVVASNIDYAECR